MPNPSIEATLRRELDSLPLPPESEWIRSSGRRFGWGTTLWLAMGVAAVALALVGGPALRDWRDSLSGGVAARPTPLVLPTVVTGIGVSPLPNISQHPELGFNLVLPPNWRESGRWTFNSGRGPELIGRITYTAHSQSMEVTLLNQYGATEKLPWDVVVEVWAAGGMNASEWARDGGGCGAGCALGTTTINGNDFITSVNSATGAHAFYVLRGERMLVLSYIVGSAAERPEGVTADTLNQIVRTVGLP